MDKPIELTGSATRNFALQAMAERLVGEEPFTKTGRTAVTLAKGDDMTAVLVVTAAGTLLGEHTAPGPVTLVVLSGSIVFRHAEGEIPVGEGEAVAFARGVAHSVKSVDDSAFLLVIGGKHDIT